MAARGASVARATCSVAEWSEQSASRRKLVSVGRSVQLQVVIQTTTEESW